MDFFAHQDAARRATRRLVVFFILAVTAITAAVYLAVRLLLITQTDGSLPLWDPGMLLTVAAVTVGVILAGSAYKTASLRGGGETVARTLGGTPLSPATRDPAERRLLNVVEEMAIAAGTPVPTVYVLEDEPGINAFAAGFTSGEAVIGVTDGCLRLLDRDELQGVIAHEMSHVLNGDMRLNLRLIGILHGILLLALIGRGVLESGRFSSGRKRKEGGGSLLLFGLALLVIGYLGVFFGRLIKSAVSRQREYLADAAAVQFTRNPRGIAGALKKIGGFAEGSRLRTPRAEEASHLFFGNALRASFWQLTATHPPLDERIRRIDPSFDGELPYVDPAQASRQDETAGAALLAPSAAAEAPPAEVSAAGAPPAEAPPAEAPPAEAPPAEAPPAEAPLAETAAPARALDVAAVTDRVGTVDEAHLAYAARLIAALPHGLADRARSRAGSEALVYALLLDRDPEVRRRQLQEIEPQVTAEVRAEIDAVAEQLASCPEEAILPLLDLTLPALRQLPATRYQRVDQNVERLVAADRRVSLREYTVQRIFRRHLAQRFGEARQGKVQYYSLRRLGEECAVLLSALARVGGRDPERVAQAFARGVAQLPELDVKLQPKGGLQEVDQALEKLALTAPRIKRQLLAAAVEVVLADRTVTVREGELLRAVAESLDCPMPPFLPGQEVAAG